MMRFDYHAPLDPECPDNPITNFDWDDPIMRMSGCAGEFADDWERKHRKDCRRCQEFGVANIEVVGP